MVPARYILYILLFLSNRSLTEFPETVATDLESFANHAGRNTVTPDDVLLITRRNDDLHDIMKDFIDKEKVNQGAKAKGKGKK